MQNRGWSRSDTIGLAAVLVTAAGVAASLFVPEIRAWLGHGPPQVDAPQTRNQSEQAVAPAAALPLPRAGDTAHLKQPKLLTISSREPGPPLRADSNKDEPPLDHSIPLPDLLRPDVGRVDRAIAIAGPDGLFDEYLSSQVAREISGRADVFSRDVILRGGLVKIVNGETAFNRDKADEVIVGKASIEQRRSSFDNDIHELALSIKLRVLGTSGRNELHIIREVGGGVDPESARTDAVRKIAATIKELTGPK